MEPMTFKAYSDSKFTKQVENTAPDGFKAMINPDTFERTLSVRTEPDKTARPGNSAGHDAGLYAEKYSFDLIFDGTGVTGRSFPANTFSDYFRQFLNTVYAAEPKPESKKQANFVEITYFGETFYTKLESMTIKYLLFNSEGAPLRIKASCHFASVEEEKPENKKKSGGKGKAKTPPPPVNDQTPNCQCVCPCPTYQETVSSAQQNDSVSLMTSRYPQSAMTPEYYTPAEGYADYSI